MQGRVRFIKGSYGFVANEGGSWFFHYSQVIGKIAAGDVVAFWLDDSPSRSSELIAVEVRRLDGQVGRVYQKA